MERVISNIPSELACPHAGRRGHRGIVFGSRCGRGSGCSCGGAAVVAALGVVEVCHRMLGSGGLVVFIRISAASDGADEPRRTTRAFPGPVLFEVVLAGLEVAARDKDDNANKAIEDGINKNTTDRD